MPDWDAMRQQMPVTRRFAYLDHAAVAPLPAPAVEAIQAWMEQAAATGDVVWPEWAARLQSFRQEAAQTLGAEAAEIGLVPNTTLGIHFVAAGIPWQPGDNLVTLENEFPSNLYPWLNLASRGVETRRVPVPPPAPEIDPERVSERDSQDAGGWDESWLEPYCDDRTRLITVSWVGYASGWRANLDRVVSLAHDRGILVMVDAIQGLGVFPLNVRETPVDFLAADGHKWLLGPEGAGILYVARQHLDFLRPQGVGWNSVSEAHDFDRVETRWKPTAGRYEGGSYNMAGFHGLAASWNFLREMGWTAEAGASPGEPGGVPDLAGATTVAQRVTGLADRAAQRLREAGARLLYRRVPDHTAGIVTFAVPGRDPAAVRRRCLEAGVVVSCRGGGVRISPHAYNNEEDLERLIAAIWP